jgi:hypothetical protein
VGNVPDPAPDQIEEMHLQAAISHERAAEVWDSEGRPEKAMTERARARDERRAAEARRIALQRRAESSH